MNWLQLVTSLPTSPSAVRVRTWRALKASGCGALRDGVYLLPDRPECARVFADLADAVREAGGDAHVIGFGARDAGQQAQFARLFDRTAEYRAFSADLARSRRALRSDSEGSGRRALRGLEQRLDALRRVDFFGNGRGEEIAAALERLRIECEARWSPGEPTGKAAADLDRLDPADLPAADLGDAAAPLGRPARERVADPPLRRSVTLASSGSRATAKLPEDRGRLRLRRRALHARRRQGDVRGR